MQSELQLPAQQIAETYTVFMRAVRELPEAALTQTFGGQTRSAAAIIGHVVSVQDLYNRVLGEGASRTDYVELPAPPPTRENLTAWLENTLAQTLALLDSLTPEQIAVPRAQSWGDWNDGSGAPLDGVWLAGQMLRHVAYHLGQINVYALILEGAA